MRVLLTRLDAHHAREIHRDRCRDVRGVHNRKGSVGQPRGFPTAQHAERKGVKSAALNAGKPLVQQQSRAVQHFLGGLAGKGEQQHGVGRDAVFGQPGQTVGVLNLGGIANLTVLIGCINAWNRIAVGLRSQHPLRAADQRAA